ncbi:uncharacterized protein [Ptychodera flava]|uniref:uncharacterized protein n=1 Tax=Ptychodera flava TaxID=63121 RepID=UPI003969EB81
MKPRKFAEDMTTVQLLVCLVLLTSNSVCSGMALHLFKADTHASSQGTGENLTECLNSCSVESGCIDEHSYSTDKQTKISDDETGGDAIASTRPLSLRMMGDARSCGFQDKDEEASTHLLTQLAHSEDAWPRDDMNMSKVSENCATLQNCSSNASETHRSGFRFIQASELVNDVIRSDKAHFHFTVDFSRIGHGRDLSLQLAVNVAKTATDLQIEVQKGHPDHYDKGKMLLKFIEVWQETLHGGWLVTDLSAEMGKMPCDKATDVDITIYVNDGDISNNATLINAGKVAVIEKLTNERIRRSDEALCTCRTSRPVTIKTSSAFPRRFGKVIDPLTFNTSFCYAVGKSGDSANDCNDQLAGSCLPIEREDFVATFYNKQIGYTYQIVFLGAIVKRCGFNETQVLDL